MSRGIETAESCGLARVDSRIVDSNGPNNQICSAASSFSALLDRSDRGTNPCPVTTWFSPYPAAYDVMRRRSWGRLRRATIHAQGRHQARDGRPDFS
jgi:hypothetical protein